MIPLAKHSPVTFSVPQVLKDLISPPRQTNSSDNSNMLHRLNSNTYTDFGTAHKHVLILSYIIRVI